MMSFLSDHAGWIGLLLFFGIFVGIVFWVLHPKNRETIEAHRLIPFQSEDEESG